MKKVIALLGAAALLAGAGCSTTVKTEADRGGAGIDAGVNTDRGGVDANVDVDKHGIDANVDTK